MNSETINLVLALFGATVTWTITVVSACFWLAGKFRVMEAQIFIEANKIKGSFMSRHYNLDRRVQRLEIGQFGMTVNRGADNDPPFDTDP